MPSIEIVCLANSIKHGGRCVAGLRLDGQGWLRPISRQVDGTLAYYHYRYADSSLVRHLDTVRVSVTKPRPAAYQPENWVIDGKPWELIARPIAAHQLPILERALVRGPAILHSETDRVPPGDVAASQKPASLALIAPERIELRKTPGKHEHPRARAIFELASPERSVRYDFSLTDPYWRDEAVCRGPIILSQAETPFVATVSLSEPFEGHCYKLVAAVIPLPTGMRLNQ